MTTLAGKTLLITGASRGIGKAIALRAARDGANVAVIAKTVDNEGKLPGTIHEAAAEIEKAGGRALALQADVRDGERIQWAVDETVKKFGGIDALVNNAGAITLKSCEELPPKRFDLITAINLRAPFLCARACIPHLRKSPNGHILNLSPPIDLDPRWFAGTTGYTVSKFGMSMLTIGLAEELRADGIAVNSLWPRTIIATAALGLLGGPDLVRGARTPEIVADAAHAILTSPARETTGNHFIDEDLLRSRGVTDFGKYAVEPGAELIPDLYVTP